MRWRIVWLGLVPLLLLVAAMIALAPEKMERGAGQARAFEPSRHFRSVVFILDSAGQAEMFDPALMPFLSSLRSSSLSGRSRSCAAKATFPCIKSIFEGQAATMGTTLQDFSAFPSSRTTWPASLAALGTRLVVASDHTLNRLYPDAFVGSLNYEDLHVPLLERDAFVYRKARQWLDDLSIDVLILHIIGTDKVSHEFPVRGPEYRQKYREVDDSIRETTSRLQPDDYLFTISDHGHNELGGHTDHAGYLARGPLFAPAVQQDLNAEDMLFLLSVPYGLLLPAEYEGQIRMELTRLAPDLARGWLTAQAKLLRVSIDDLPIDQAQLRLNNEITRRRTTGERAEAIGAVWRVGPFWLAAALFLFWELGAGRRPGSKPGRPPLFLVELAVLAVAAFWILPLGLTAVHETNQRWIFFVGFYLAAGSWGFVRSGIGGQETPRAAILNTLWIVGLCLWLLAYFGPLGYSLTRHGSLIILAVLPIAAVAVTKEWRNVFSWPVFLWPALLPVIWYDVESFNLKFTLVDLLAEWAVTFQIIMVGAAATLFAFVLRKPLRSPAFAVAWVTVGALFFQFSLPKLTAALLACAWFAGCLELFRRARLPLRWSALISVVFLFVLLSFFLNGFALSHVDFRFAANKIIPFAKEIWRAPQLILWAMAKYAVALAPALLILHWSAGERVWRQLLLLGWWRELFIVASALGLAIFNARGMHDLCAEEIYFWTFLNLVIFVVGLIAITKRRHSFAWKPA